MRECACQILVPRNGFLKEKEGSFEVNLPIHSFLYPFIHSFIHQTFVKCQLSDCMLRG